MKRAYLVQLISLFIGVALLAGCSKGDQLVPNPANADKMVKAPPIYTGHITGELVPAPDFALIKVYNDEYSANVVAGSEGLFKVAYIPEGVYTVVITYEFIVGETTHNGSLEIQRVGVKGGDVTELGNIKIPSYL